MHHITVTSILLGALLAVSSASILAKTGASGTVSIPGNSQWVIVDAVAVLNEKELRIVFSEKPFNRAVWDDDLEFDTDDLEEIIDNKNEDAKWLIIGAFNNSKAYTTVAEKVESNDTARRLYVMNKGLTVSARDDEHIAGTFKLSANDSEDFVAEISFDLPIEKYGPLPMPGIPLPPDGGEPGKALKSYMEALFGDDTERLLNLSHPEGRAEMKSEQASGEYDESLKMMRRFTPAVDKILGGKIDGNRAWVEFATHSADGKFKGSARMIRIEDRWYLKGTSVDRSAKL